MALENCLQYLTSEKKYTEKRKFDQLLYENWKLKEESYEGYAARIIQHEYDLRRCFYRPSFTS